MKEEFSTFTKGTPEHEAFRANVRLPQVWTAIKLVKLLENIRKHGLEQAVDVLANPTPLDDETLDRMVHKANAQHASINIGKLLTREDIQRIIHTGNMQSLYLIGEMFGVHKELNTPQQEDAKTIRTKIHESNQKDFIINLLTGVSAELDTPEVIELMKTYKAYYTDWALKSEQERNVIKDLSGLALRKIQGRLVARARAEFERVHGTPEEKNEQRTVLEGFVKALFMSEV